MSTAFVAADDPDVLALTVAIEAGDVEAVRAALAANPALATARFGDDRMSREVLHVVTDWPGRRPRCAETIAVLIAAGADVDARFAGPHRETPLHWAASSDDVEAIDALLAAGADLEAPGGVLTDGPPLDDAVVFGQWEAGRRLVEHGAATRLFHAAALGLDDRVRELLSGDREGGEITNGLWHASNAGHSETARLLLGAGGDPSWVGWENQTPLDAARAGGHEDVVRLLEEAIGRSR